MNRLVFASTLSIRREDGTAGPNQSLDRLPFKPDFAALLLEFPRTQVKLEDPESEKDPLALIISGDLAEEHVIVAPPSDLGHRWHRSTRDRATSRAQPSRGR